MRARRKYPRFLIVVAAASLLLILLFTISERHHIRSGRRNVVLITIDTLRADKLGIVRGGGCIDTGARQPGGGGDTIPEHLLSGTDYPALAHHDSHRHVPV